MCPHLTFRRSQKPLYGSSASQSPHQHAEFKHRPGLVVTVDTHIQIHPLVSCPTPGHQVGLRNAHRQRTESIAGNAANRRRPCVNRTLEILVRLLQRQSCNVPLIMTGGSHWRDEPRRIQQPDRTLSHHHGTNVSGLEPAWGEVSAKMSSKL